MKITEVLRRITTPDAIANATPLDEKFTPSGLNMYVSSRAPSKCDKPPSSFDSSVKRTIASVDHGSSVPSAPWPNWWKDQ